MSRCFSKYSFFNLLILFFVLTTSFAQFNNPPGGSQSTSGNTELPPADFKKMVDSLEKQNKATLSQQIKDEICSQTSKGTCPSGGGSNASTVPPPANIPPSGNTSTTTTTSSTGGSSSVYTGFGSSGTNAGTGSGTGTNPSNNTPKQPPAAGGLNIKY